MHTDTKLSNVGSANRADGSCCGHGEPSPAHPVKPSTAKPSAAPEQSPADRRAEKTREAAQGKSKGCCCGS